MNKEEPWQDTDIRYIDKSSVQMFIFIIIIIIIISTSVRQFDIFRWIYYRLHVIKRWGERFNSCCLCINIYTNTFIYTETDKATEKERERENFFLLFQLLNVTLIVYVYKGLVNIVSISKNNNVKRKSIRLFFLSSHTFTRLLIRLFFCSLLSFNV